MAHIELLNDEVEYLETFMQEPQACDPDDTGGGGGCGCDTYVCGVGNVSCSACNLACFNSCNVDACGYDVL